MTPNDGQPIATGLLVRIHATWLALATSKHRESCGETETAKWKLRNKNRKKPQDKNFEIDCTGIS
jgi:hypothetical protein